MSSHLQSGARVDISKIQEASRDNLISLIERCSGPKAIICDDFLEGPVGLVAKYKSLREHEVVKMYPLHGVPLPETNVAHLIFVTRPQLHLMDYVAQNVHDFRARSGQKKHYHLFFVPRRSLLCEERLKHRGVYANLSIEEFQCTVFPFDSDLLSMELPDVYRNVYLEGDPTPLYQVAHAIMFIQEKYGRIPRIWGKGAAARQVWDMVCRLQKERATHDSTHEHQNSYIDQMILIDRSIDLISPLATQLTYEGLIDEIFGISYAYHDLFDTCGHTGCLMIIDVGLNNTTANFPADKFLSTEEKGAESLAEAKKQIILNSGDKLFAELRDKNFNAVGAYLSKQAKLITAQLEDYHQKSVREMKLLVQKLPTLLASKEALAQHTAIAEYIKEITDGYEFLDCLQAEQEFLNCIEVDKVSPFIEDLIAQQKPLIKVLRLICLQSLANSGLKPKVLEYYKREIVQVYGLEALPLLINLTKVGLLKPQSSTRQYAILRKALRLTMEDTSEVNPTDISYVHSVYAPLSVRLVEQLLKHGGWKQLQDVIGLLPGGPVLDELNTDDAFNDEPSASSPNVVLVFFIGGCTFAEISALRFLSQQEDSNVEFVIATTKLINGTSFLEATIDTKETR